MNKNKIQILILGFIGILTGGVGCYYLVEAAAPSVYVSPATLSKNVGETFDISVGVSPAGQKVCVIEGKLNLDKLSCQSIPPTVPDGVSVQSWPSCSNLYFLLGIQGCTTSNKTLFTVNVRAGSAGTATANFTGVDVIGEGVSISSLSSGGSYTLTSLVPPTCSCTNWSAWQSGICGGGGCLASQRLQTRTRTCTPIGCDIESGSQCIEDSSCVPVGEEVVPPKEAVSPEEGIVTVPPEERVPGGGLAPLLLASLAFSWGNLLEGKLFNNPIFWALIASLGILFSGFSMIEKPRKIFGVIGFIGIWSLLISSIFLPLPIIDQLRIPLPDFIALPIGILFFLGGILIIYLAFKKLSFQVASDITKPKELVTTRIYGIVRHPLYLGLIIAYLGWCFIFKASLALLFAPVAFLFLLILAIFEEKDLIKTYGNIYREYQKRVPQRIIPKIL